jgi:small subunit ribosomal protein S19e
MEGGHNKPLVTLAYRLSGVYSKGLIALVFNNYDSTSAFSGLPVLSEVMANVYDVEPSILVKATADKLKEKLKKPGYIDYVKSGAGRDRIPEDPDFWYIRGASILRQVYLNGPVGVSRLRTRYGNRKESVVHKKHHVNASGSIIRDEFQQLESLNYIKKTKTGRIITPAGRSFLDKIAKEISKNN